MYAGADENAERGGSVSVCLNRSGIPALGIIGEKQSLRFEVTIADSVQKSDKLTGHLILCIARPDADEGKHGRKGEPCHEIQEGYDTQEAIGTDVEQLAPGAAIVVDDRSFGNPIVKLSELPAGDYVVQAVFNRYEEYHLGSGKTVWLPPDKGEGQFWNRKPGNPMSAPVKMHLDATKGGVMKLTLDQVIPPVTPTDADTTYLKHIQIKSAMLSKFWGRDVPSARWCCCRRDGTSIRTRIIRWWCGRTTFSRTFARRPRGARRLRQPMRPASPSSTRRTAIASIRTGRHGVLPHVILVVLNHANPYYDDSYAVNSANLGRYGDAITQEVIPEIERRYHGIGSGWARGTLGGSTGGWEALAQQISIRIFITGRGGCVLILWVFTRIGTQICTNTRTRMRKPARSRRWRFRVIVRVTVT